MGLNKSNYEFHGSRFWHNSYFVIGPGVDWPTNRIRWLERLAWDVKEKIQNVYINLDAVDIECSSSRTTAERLAWDTYRLGGVSREIMAQLHNDALVEIWCDKMMSLTRLKLRNLVIDCRNAYGADDSFLGEMFMYEVPWFGEQRPENVKILAKNEEQTGKLLALFNSVNPIQVKLD